MAGRKPRAAAVDGTTEAVEVRTVLIDDAPGKVRALRTVALEPRPLRAWLQQVREDMEDVLADLLREERSKIADLRDATPDLWRGMIVRFGTVRFRGTGKEIAHRRSKLDRWDPLQVVGVRSGTVLFKIVRRTNASGKIESKINANDPADPRRRIYASAAVAAVADAKVVGEFQALQQGAALAAWFTELRTAEITSVLQSHQGTTGGKHGAGKAKRPHTKLIRHAVEALTEKGLRVSAANVRLLLKSRWQKLTLEWGDPLRDIVGVQVREEAPVVVEYTKEWVAGGKGRQQFTELNADALNKQIARAKEAAAR